MRIAFATTQSATGSTMLGRVLPLGKALAAQGHSVHVLLMKSAALPAGPPTFWVIGTEPFTRTLSGKIRLHGGRLALNMAAAAGKTFWRLRKIRPEIVVISKPLPANTAGVWLYHFFNRRVKIVLDADDFELTANSLSSFLQRAVIHGSTRLAVRISHAIVVATPFLSDYFTSLVNHQTKVSLVVTGHVFNAGSEPEPVGPPTILYLGSLSVHSGHRVDLLPEILAQVTRAIPKVNLLLAGTGDDQQRLRREFERRGLVRLVTWHGRFAVSEIPALLRRSHLLIDPIDASITQRAKSSFRVMAALAFGRGIVTSNVGVRGMLVPPKLHEYFFTPPGDTAAYAQQCIARLREELPADARAELRRAGEAYHWHNLAQRYQAILEAV